MFVVTNGQSGVPLFSLIRDQTFHWEMDRGAEHLHKLSDLSNSLTFLGIKCIPLWAFPGHGMIDVEFSDFSQFPGPLGVIHLQA